MSITVSTLASLVGPRRELKIALERFWRGQTMGNCC